MMTYNDYLAHYGIQGMKWGIRRYQNPDGSLTSAGRARYGKQIDKYRSKLEKKYMKQLHKAEKKGNVALKAATQRRLDTVRRMSDSDVLYEKKKVGKDTRLGAGLGAGLMMLKNTPKILKRAKQVEYETANMYIDDIPVKDSKTKRAKATALISMYATSAIEGGATWGAMANVISKANMDKSRNRHYATK